MSITYTPIGIKLGLEIGLSDLSTGVAMVFYTYLYTGLRHFMP